jgi:hypothetical protein
MTEKPASVNQHVDPDRFYVTNGEVTTGPYKSENRAHRRKARWNNSPETERAWTVVPGDVVRDDEDVPLPE